MMSYGTRIDSDDCLAVTPTGGKSLHNSPMSQLLSEKWLFL